MSLHFKAATTIAALSLSLIGFSASEAILRPSEGAAATTTDCPSHTVNGHPVNCGGFVTDGSPQLSDGKCVGNDLQKSECYEARRPACNGHDNNSPLSWNEALSCWAPEINLYPWPKVWAMNVLYCESKGADHATNGQFLGLMQEGDNYGSYDGGMNIYVGYHHFYVGGGPNQWSTNGKVCH